MTVTREEIRRWLNLAERQARTVVLEIDSFVVHLLIDYDSATDQQLTEAKKPISLGKHYTGRIDKPKDGLGQEHIHVYVKNRHLFAMNVDGSAHDGSNQFQIPNVVAKEIGRQFRHFQLPPNNFIEWLDDATTKILLD